MNNNQLSENQKDNIKIWLLFQVIIPIGIIVAIFILAYMFWNTGDLPYQFFGTGDLVSPISLLIISALIEDIKNTVPKNKLIKKFLYYVIGLISSIFIYLAVKIQSLQPNITCKVKLAWILFNLTYFIICVTLLYFQQLKLEKLREQSNLDNQIESL